MCLWTNAFMNDFTKTFKKVKVQRITILVGKIKINKNFVTGYWGRGNTVKQLAPKNILESLSNYFSLATTHNIEPWAGIFISHMQRDN